MLDSGKRVVRFLTKDKSRLWNVGAVLAVALMLLWPAFVNGEPFYMSDTSSYLRGADAAVYHLTGKRSAWTNEYLKRYPADTKSHPETSSLPPAPSEQPVVLTGRSIYYGLLLYASQWLGNFWAVAIFQALLVAIAISLTVRILGRKLEDEPGPGSVLIVGALVAMSTSVGYFASYLLPDVYGALALLAFGHLVFLWKENDRISRLFWFGLLVLAMLFHLSNFLLVAILGVVAFALLLVSLPATRTGLGMVCAALLIAGTGHILFSWMVKQTTGEAPIAPPFLAARIIDDGPGYEYLRTHCPDVQLIYCRAVGLKSRISDSLLWSADPSEGIFQALTPSERRLAAAQQREFVLAVAKENPVALIGSSIGAFFRQLTDFKLESFNYSPGNIEYFEQKIPSPFLEQARQSKAYQRRMPVQIVETMTLVGVLLSVMAIVWIVGRMVTRTKRLSATGAFLLFMLAGALANAVICGAISTPKGRYQMRLIWILPLTALATIGAQRRDVREEDFEVSTQPRSLPAE